MTSYTLIGKQSTPQHLQYRENHTLVAQGMSNPEVAASLVISEYAVIGKVSNILGKLHLADRTQAAVFAWQQGVVKRNK